MNIILTFLLCLLSVSASATPEQLKIFEKQCQEKVGLSCAKAGYYHRQAKNNPEATRFYQLGCDLKDETSCNNVHNFSEDDLFSARFNTSVQFYESGLRKCNKQQDMSKVASSMQLVEKWYLVDFQFDIDKDGKPLSIKVANTNLPKDFVTCAEHLLMNLKYPKPPRAPLKINYRLNVAFYEKI